MMRSTFTVGCVVPIVLLRHRHLELQCVKITAKIMSTNTTHTDAESSAFTAIANSPTIGIDPCWQNFSPRTWS